MHLRTSSLSPIAKDCRTALWCVEAETHINFGAVELPIREWNTRSKSEIRDCAGLHIKHRTDTSISERAGIAKHIHQESIGTCTGIQLSPYSYLGSWHGLATLCMDLLQ